MPPGAGPAGEIASPCEPYEGKIETNPDFRDLEDLEHSDDLKNSEVVGAGRDGNWARFHGGNDQAWIEGFREAGKTQAEHFHPTPNTNG